MPEYPQVGPEHVVKGFLERLRGSRTRCRVWHRDSCLCYAEAGAGLEPILRGRGRRRKAWRMPAMTEQKSSENARLVFRFINK